MQCWANSPISNQICRMVSDCLGGDLWDRSLGWTICPCRPLTFSFSPFLNMCGIHCASPYLYSCYFGWKKKKTPRNSLSIYWECKVFAKTAFCLLLPLFILWGRFCYLLWVTEEETDAQRGETGCSRLQSLQELLDEAPLYKLSHVGYPSLFQIEKLFKIPKSNPTVV